MITCTNQSQLWQQRHTTKQQAISWKAVDALGQIQFINSLKGQRTIM